VTAEYMSGKLYRYFVRDDVPAATKIELGKTLRDANYQMKPLLKRIFISKDFYSPPAFATQIKSPVHLVVSTYKKMGLTEIPTIPDFGRMTAGLGQSLFDPPNVAGWAGGRTWVTPSTLLQRGNLIRDVMFPDVKGFRPPDRAMSLTDQRVGERLAKGMNITETTKGRRRVEHDGRPRRGLQHTLRRLQGRDRCLGAHQAHRTPSCADRDDIARGGGRRRYGGEGR
jgi:uncharacterized protein (DUF1800 family)